MRRCSKIRVGDLVRVETLPKFWGGEDIRGEVGLVTAHHISNESGWYRVMICEKSWTLPDRCVAIVQPGRGDK